MENGKLIINNKSDQRIMTFDEVYVQYQDVIRKSAHSWTNYYEYDDLYQTASFALWKAYRDYDSNKGFVFLTAAYRYIDNALLAFHGKHKPKFDKVTSQVKSMASLNKTLSNGDGEELMDLVVQNDSFAEDVIDRILLNGILNQLPNHQRQDVINYANGFNYRELAKGKGVTSQTVSNRLKASFAKLKVLYNQELNVGV